MWPMWSWSRILIPLALALISLAAILKWLQRPDLPAKPPGISSGTEFTTALGHRKKEMLDQSLNPQQAGWETEHQAMLLGERLDTLLKSASDKGPLPPNLATKDVSVTPLATDSLQETFRSEAVTVHEMGRPSPPEEGLDALATFLRTTSEGLALKAKIIEIQTDDPRTDTVVLVEGNSPSRQVRSRWLCEWASEDPDAPLLKSLRCESYQESRSDSIPWFQDNTPNVMQDLVGYEQQFNVGLDSWLTRIERTHGMRYFNRHGLAVADVNGDGRDDLYVCQAGGLPNRLFIQQADGTCTDVSHSAGVDWLDQTSSALFVDLDNDGDQDLALATFEGVLILEQHEPLKFQNRTLLELKNTDLQSLSAADVDGDGRLDLYLCVDFADPQDDGSSTAFVYHDANDGGANVLWRNAITGPGNWAFIDVTKSSGLDTNNRRHSLAAAWEDYDNDGDQDLYVANDYGQNCLYQNDDGTFKEIAPAAGVVDYGSGMSVSWGDANRDGFMDLYVGNMFSSAGSRLTTQAQFLDQTPPEVKALYSRFSKGNSLYENEMGASYKDVSLQSGVAMGRWAWSSLFADVNNDGWEDLLVSNGYITTEDSGDL
jgi:hypothetical protein